MVDPTRESVLQVLRDLPLPDASGVSVADAVENLEVSGERVTIAIRTGFPLAGAVEDLRTAVQQALSGAGVAESSVTVEWTVPALRPANSQKQVAGVKNIIAVASGKGGVGKSTTAVNLALALVREGARVGVLDADIYGPSQPQMLGVANERPQVKEGNRIVPLRAHGLQCISMGNLVTEKTPMVWRGPMATGALQQLLNQTLWDDVDYLVVDMPPGTGDIQLTLAQSVPVSGAVIVTTPQDIALLDAKKGIEMFRKVSIPVLGVVENMALHICSNCGHREAIFGERGGERLASEYEVNLLGQLPLQLSIREETDAGRPPVATDPESDVSLVYRRVARQVGATLWQQALEAGAGPEISITDD